MGTLAEPKGKSKKAEDLRAEEEVRIKSRGGARGKTSEGPSSLRTGRKNGF